MSVGPRDQREAGGGDEGRDRPAGLTVAVTGPTGAVGRAVIRALEQDDRVGRILGMARKPLEVAFLGWRKTTYRRGDVLDRAAVSELVADADVVIHLAYAILGSRRESARVNVTGSRNVFETALLAGQPSRLVFMSSVAAYGYHADNPVPLTEDAEARGSPGHYYSAHKAECEALLAELTAGSRMEAYVLRPCLVAGPDAMPLIRNLQQVPVLDRLPAVGRRLLARLPNLRPLVPDAGVPIQLVHHDDVGTAVRAAALGDGPPGAYNLAAAGEVTMTDLAKVAGAHPVSVPHVLAVASSQLVNALPWVPAEVEWVHVVRYPMLMDTKRAHRDLSWKPRYTAREALESMKGTAFSLSYSANTRGELG
ncbi:MAG: NAD-dependent epimerase/dehydratase family protein [Streptosporangiaceae bacterium]|jgi:nucleoside-diphosphate-sugar epimerase